MIFLNWKIKSENHRVNLPEDFDRNLPHFPATQHPRATTQVHIVDSQSAILFGVVFFFFGF